MEIDVKKLKKENEFLFDAITRVLDFSSGIIILIEQNKISEARQKADELQMFALDAMSKSKGGPDANPYK